MSTGSVAVLGRPRSADAHSAILDAALAITREAGFDALAMDAIAARAGVGKATVYRRWKTKESVVAEALARFARAIPVPDTGQLATDLRTVMRGNMRMYQDPATAQLLSGLIAAMARNTVIADAVRSGFVAARRDALRQVLARGIARGELSRSTDIDLTLDMLSGPLLYRALVSGGRIDDRMIARLVKAVLRGFAPQRRGEP